MGVPALDTCSYAHLQHDEPCTLPAGHLHQLQVLYRQLQRL